MKPARREARLKIWCACIGTLSLDSKQCQFLGELFTRQDVRSTGDGKTQEDPGRPRKTLAIEASGVLLLDVSSKNTE